MNDFVVDFFQFVLVPGFLVSEEDEQVPDRSGRRGFSQGTVLLDGCVFTAQRILQDFLIVWLVTQFGQATASDICDAPVISNDAPPVFPLRMTSTVTWTATDDSNNMNTDTQTVTIVDTTPPDIVCPANVALEPTDLTCGMTFSTGATVNDRCDLTPTVEISPSPSMIFSKIGEHAISFTATDASANSSSCSTTVTVLPTPFCEKSEANQMLESLVSVDSGDNDLIDAIGSLNMSLGMDDDRAGVSGSEVVWGDPNHVDACHSGFKGVDVFQYEQNACDKLEAYLENDENQSFNFGDEIEVVRQALASADGSLASTAIADAIAASGDADLISVALELKAEGDAAMASGEICDVALDKYEEAWEKAVASYCEQ